MTYAMLLPHGDTLRGRELPSSRVGIRPLQRDDLGVLMITLGPLVDSLYPKGARKLLTRLEDALNGDSAAYVTQVRGFGPISLASETSKGRRRVKLSTFWVDPRFRGIGVGASLLDHRIKSWQQADFDSAVVTVREERAPQLERLFIPRGFSRIVTDLDKYGEGQNEVVLKWTAEPASTTPTRLTLLAS